MTKLELTVSTSSWKIVRCLNSITAQVLDISDPSDARDQPNLSALLADEGEFYKFKDHVELALQSSSSFTTLNLVFKAPNAATKALKANRTPLDAVFRSPSTAVHSCGEMEIACFTHVEIVKKDYNQPDADGQDDNDGAVDTDTSGNDFLLVITAVEYSRTHRDDLLRQEFGSWLLEDNIEKAVIATTVTGTVCFWNRYAEILYQYTKEEAMGKCIMDLTPSDMTLDQAHEIFGNLGRGEHWRGMFKVRRKDKSEFMAHVTDTPVISDTGELRFVVGVSADYSQLHNVMEELETMNVNLERLVQERTQKLVEGQRFLRMVGAAIEASDTGAVVTDKDFRILWKNHALRKLLGLCEGESVIGSLAWELPLNVKDIHEVDPDKLGDHSASLHDFLVQGTGTAACVTLMNPEKNPGVELLSVSVRKIENQRQQEQGEDKQDDGGDARYLITVSDQTLQKKAQESKMAAELAAEASKAKSETIQMLSHELRTPLQGIMGIASTLLEDLSPEDTNMCDCLSTVLASSRVLLMLINNVLDLGKIEANMMNEIELSPIPSDQCIRETIQYCRPFAVLHEVGLHFEDNGYGDHHPSAPANVMGSRLHLQQVLTNLVSNSVKYTKPDTDVTVSMRCCTISDAFNEVRNAAGSDLMYLSQKELDKVQDEIMGLCGQKATIISVRDKGRGIPEKDFNRVFGHYVQLDISKEKDRAYKGGSAATAGQSSGSGLGLNLAMNFVRRMNGHIWFNNCSPGVQFSFYLVNRKDEAISDTSLDGSMHSGTASITSRPSAPLLTELDPDIAAKLKVLLVDDSMINLRVLTRMLSKIGVEQLVAVNSGAKALAVLREATKKNRSSSSSFFPNLILSDLQMPEMDGFELMGHLRDLSMPTPEAPAPIIVACSADWSSKTETKCLEIGFDSVLRKPVAFSELKEFLANVAALHGIKNV